MKYVPKLKQFSPENYSIRLDQKASKVIFPYIGSKVWNDGKRLALLNIPQSTHRLPYKEITKLLESDTHLSCLDISNIVMCMQHLSMKDFISQDEYLIFMKENAKVIDTLQEFYSGFDEKIELDLEEEVRKEKRKPKILNLNGTSN